VAGKKTLNGKLCKLVDQLVDQGLTLDQARREFEKQFIISALKSNSGNVSRSASAIGVHRNTLRNKAGSLGIQPNQYGTRRNPTTAAKPNKN